MQVKADINRAGWEDAEFPIVCETCLGENPYVRMTKKPFGQACKICERPFTVFRWKAGSGRYKATQICQTCAKMKNVCQTCVLDLTYGLPVEVRDSFLAEHERTKVPVSTVMRDYVAQEMDAQQAGALMVPGAGMGGIGGAAGGGLAESAHEGLMRLARRQPKYKRNLAHICSFFARGECNRGDSCPYRHEMPTDKSHPFAKQNIKDRFYGVDDPVAAAMLKRAGLRGGGDGSGAKLGDPDVRGATKLWIGRVTESITEADLREALSKYDGLTNVFISRRSSCAFVDFATHEQARAAGDAIVGNFKVNESDLVVGWAKGRPGEGGANSAPAPAAARAAPPASAPQASGGLGGLAAYGSDSEDEAGEKPAAAAAASAAPTSAAPARAGAGAGGGTPTPTPSSAAPQAPAVPATSSRQPVQAPAVPFPPPPGGFGAAALPPPPGMDIASLIPPPPGTRPAGRGGPLRSHGPGGTNRYQAARATPYPSMDPGARGSRVKMT